jgi:hypothetical protein
LHTPAIVMLEYFPGGMVVKVDVDGSPVKLPPVQV